MVKPENDSCDLCGASGFRRKVSPRLAVVKCPRCGHRSARHEGQGPGTTDYHEQYDQSSFLDSLKQTRVRQARRILDLIRVHAPSASRLLDFGCGRGWFLEEARSAGFADLAGADSSPLAVETLRQRGFQILPVPPGRPEDLDPGALSFRPQVLVMLDVLEHFPAQKALTLLKNICARSAPGPELVVIKVPLSSGILYAAASLLGLFGAAGFIEQLYQVGTSPPHLSYFSRRSLEQLLSTSGLSLVGHIGDRDFEPTGFAGRVSALRGMPSWMAHGAGTMLSLAVSLSGKFDSIIAAARPRP